MKIDNPQENAKLRVRQLVWVYFWLLVFEGTLRKWLLPRFSDALLVVRDPVVFLIYYFAIRARVFPRNGWMIVLGSLGFCSAASSVIELWPYITPLKAMLLVGYGFRCNFFQLPLIFVIASVFGREDLKKLGWWVLLFSLPLTLLAVVQFSSSPDAFINRTAAGGSEVVMMSALGKVRTSGTFTFVVGMVMYYALATAFLVWAVLRRTIYHTRLLMAAGIAIAIGVSVSGSRSAVAACALVVASLVIVLIFRPDMLNRFGQALVVALVLGLIVSRTPIFREGMMVLSTRFNEAAAGTDQSIARSLVTRPLGVFEDAYSVVTRAPWFGYGLGVGTNAGAKFLVGRSLFLLTEGEWSRILLEAGPIFGIAYLAWRTALVAWIGWLAFKSLRAGHLLPLLLFAAGFLPLLSGQLGQPTILGFAVLVAGLALAARSGETPSPSRAATHAQAPRRIIQRRSAYAERLHGSPDQPTDNNGSADR